MHAGAPQGCRAAALLGSLWPAPPALGGLPGGPPNKCNWSEWGTFSRCSRFAWLDPAQELRIWHGQSVSLGLEVDGQRFSFMVQVGAGRPLPQVMVSPSVFLAVRWLRLQANRHHANPLPSSHPLALECWLLAWHACFASEPVALLLLHRTAERA